MRFIGTIRQFVLPGIIHRYHNISIILRKIVLLVHYGFTRLKQWKLITLLTGLVLLVRFPLLLHPERPLNDGGLFLSVTRLIRENPFQYPEYMAYNHLNIPFAYPPLGMYIVAGISAFFTKAEIQLFTLIPVLFNIACIPLIFILSYQLTKSRTIAVLSTLLTAVIPESYQWTIMGGGITRAPGAFFALLALVHVLAWQKKPTHLKFMVAILSTGAVFLSHPDTAVFVVYSLFLFAIADTQRSFIHRLMVFAGILFFALAIASPWILTVVYEHSPDPFLHVLRIRGRNGFPMENLIWILSNEMQYRVLLVTALIGVVTALKSGERRILTWFIFVLIFRATAMLSFDIFPLAILSALGISTIPKILNKESHKTIFWCTVGVFLVLSFPWSVQQITTRFPKLQQTDIDALNWIRYNTPEHATFIIITPKSEWWKDNVPEWFPALSERKSLVTVQGSEWLPFSQHKAIILFHQAIRRCNTESITCIETAAKNAGVEYTHIYMEKYKDQPGVSDYCPLLLHSIRASVNYKVIYGNMTGEIWEKISE